jgi:hypothetical protein
MFFTLLSLLKNKIMQPIHPRMAEKSKFKRFAKDAYSLGAEPIEN